jgi:hypothetical protein
LPLADSARYKLSRPLQQLSQSWRYPALGPRGARRGEERAVRRILLERLEDSQQRTEGLCVSCEPSPRREKYQALTTDGMILWRRRMGDSLARTTAQLAEPHESSVPAGRLDSRSPSVCDSLSPGMGGQEIRDLLHQRHVSFSEVRRMSACGPSRNRAVSANYGSMIS